MDELKGFRDFIKVSEWIDAKTYRKIAPHEYALKFKLGEKDKKMMIEFASYIKKNGYTKLFWGKQFKYLDLDGYKYWTMEENPEKTILVNREKLKDEIEM